MTILILHDDINKIYKRACAVCRDWRAELLMEAGASFSIAYGSVMPPVKRRYPMFCPRCVAAKAQQLVTL